MSFNQKEDHVLTNSEGTIFTKVKDFNYLGSFIGSTAHDIDERIAKAWGEITSMTKIWKSKLSERLERNFFRATVESVLTYGATTWTLTKTLENRLNGPYTRMLRAALNKLWKEHLTNEELYKRIQWSRTLFENNVCSSRDIANVPRSLQHVGEPITNWQALYYSGNLNKVNGYVDAQLRRILINWLKIQNAP